VFFSEHSVYYITDKLWQVPTNTAVDACYLETIANY